MSNPIVERGGEQVDVAVEMMKAGRSPDSVRRALVALGLSDTDAGTLVTELARLEAEQRQHELDQQQQRDAKLASITRATQARNIWTGIFFMITGIVILARQLGSFSSHQEQVTLFDLIFATVGFGFALIGVLRLANVV